MQCQCHHSSTLLLSCELRNTQEVSCFGLRVIFVEEIAQRTWLLPSESLQLCIDGSSSGTSLAILQEVSSFGGWLACDSACSRILFRRAFVEVA